MNDSETLDKEAKDTAKNLGFKLAGESPANNIRQSTAKHNAYEWVEELKDRSGPDFDRAWATGMAAEETDVLNKLTEAEKSLTGSPTHEVLHRAVILLQEDRRLANTVSFTPS